MLHVVLVTLISVALSSSLTSATSTDSNARIVTGHRLIRSDRDFDLYVIRESLPTLLLVHSSNEADCDPSQASCAELFEDVKAVAAETKGYIRFATIDVAEPEGAQLAKNVLRMTNKPPAILVFKEKSEGTQGGRPAMKMPTQPKPTVSQLKRIVGELLPTDVHRSKSLGDFEKLVLEATGNKKPVVALLAPKLSEKPTAMVKAAWAMLKGISNFTLIDYSTEGGKEIVQTMSSVLSPDALVQNQTFIVGIDDSKRMIKSNDTAVSPDSIHEFAVWLASSLRKSSADKRQQREQQQQETKRKRFPPGVYANITHEDFEKVAIYPNPPCICAFYKPAVPVVPGNETLPPADPSTNLTWPLMATGGFSQFGAHAAIVYCDHSSNQPKPCAELKPEEWSYQVYLHRPLSQKDKKVVRVNTLGEALEKAGESVVEGEKLEEDPLETFSAGSSAADFLQSTMNIWANPSLRSQARLPLLFFDNAPDADAPPKFLLAAHATVRSIARIVRVRNPSLETLKQLHLNPAVTFLPVMVAYVPNFEEVPIPEEADAKGRGGKKKPQQKEQRMSFHVVPFDAQKSGLSGLQYETAVLFIQDLFNRVDKERWENFMQNVIPLTAPTALSSPISERFAKTKVQDTSPIPLPQEAHDKDSLQSACGGAALCVMVFAEKFEDARKQAIEDARKGLEKSAFGNGVRFALVDGSCHGRVVEALGGDPTMLPVVAAWSPSKNVCSIMKGTFSADAIQSLVRNVKRGGVAAQPVTKSPFDSFSDMKDCISPEESKQGQVEEEDDLMRELREEAERELRQKELARKQAEEDSKKLKEQREAELKSQREKLNKLAEEERAAKRRAQQELDEQRLAKKREQQRLDEERLAAKKQKEKSEL